MPSVLASIGADRAVDVARPRDIQPPVPAESALPRLVADLLRCLALVAVIAIHADDAWRAVVAPPQGWHAWAIVVVDQLARFCVPLFVLLSGHALGKRYAAGCDAGAFLARRATRIGAPYLAWSLLDLGIALALGVTVWHQPVGQALRVALHATGGAESTARAGLRWLASGGADYHLYFLPIIAQCYLLFPLLRRWRCTAGAVAVAVTVQVGLLAWLEAARMVPGLRAPQLWSVFPLYWLGYFQAGVWLAAHDDAAALRLRRCPGWVIAALALSGPAAVLADLAWAGARHVPPEYAGAFDRPAVCWYLMMTVLAALRWGHHVEGWRPRMITAVGGVASASFAAYLAHTWVLRGLAAMLGADSAGAAKPGGRWLWIPLAVIASVAVGWALQQAAQRWRRLGWLVG